MNIAFLGSRGIPRCYSGFETFVEEVAVRLVERGHLITVYNRVPFNQYRESSFRGVRIVLVPTLQFKGTDTLIHSALCSLHATTQPYDVVYICGVGSSLFSILPKMRGARAVVNVDGADWARAKWGRIGKTWLRWSEMIAASLADTVIADHPIIADRYRSQFNIDCAVIGYGADVMAEDPGTATLEKYGLASRKYFLFVSRLTPENQADFVMQSYLDSGSQIPLVVVGDAPYVGEYLSKVKQLANASEGRIRLTGYQFGEAYQQLSFHARAYVYPTSIDATRPVILEQMGMGACIFARDTRANRHVLGDAAIWFSDDSASEGLNELFQQASLDETALDRYRHLARQRVSEHYNWDRVTDQYEALFERLLKN